MKKILFFITMFLMLGVYVLLINIFVANIIELNTQNQTIYTIGGNGQKISVSNTIDISIKRLRWYGVIYGDGDNETLYLFWIIPLPLKHNRDSFVVFHMLFFLLWCLILIIGLMFLNIKKGGEEWESYQRY